jgi:hypothetical protein
MAIASPIARLVQQLAKLPGIGEKTAARLAFHILRASPEDAAALASAIGEVRQKIRFCSVCCDLTEADPCAICADARRDAAVVCVVAQPQDVLAIERAGGYHGRYHVLHGVLSPLDGIGRRGGDRGLPGQAAPPARRSDDPHRHRGADGRRAGVRRPGDTGPRHRRPARDVGECVHAIRRAKVPRKVAAPTAPTRVTLESPLGE